VTLMPENKKEQEIRERYIDALDAEDAKLVRRVYLRVVPLAWRLKIAEYAKGAVAAAGVVGQAVNYFAPAYSDEVQAVVGTVLGLLTLLGVVRVPNRDEDRLRGRWARREG
jgi:hypothetical protein